MPRATPDQVEAIVAKLTALRAARTQLDADEEATVIEGRLTGVPWNAMAAALGTRGPWLCEYYKPRLPKLKLTVDEAAAAVDEAQPVRPRKRGRPGRAA